MAKVFRAKLLAAIEAAGLSVPATLAQQWVVDCRCVGDGSKALLYLGRYLYRGVIQAAIAFLTFGEVLVEGLDRTARLAMQPEQ